MSSSSPTGELPSIPSGLPSVPSGLPSVSPPPTGGAPKNTNSSPATESVKSVASEILKQETQPTTPKPLIIESRMQKIIREKQFDKINQRVRAL